MTRAGLDRAVMLLAAGCVVAALGSSAGCRLLRPCGGTRFESFDSGLGRPIVAVAPRAAIDGRGRVYSLDHPEQGWSELEHPLRDVRELGERTPVAVGDRGLIVARDWGNSWTRWESGTTADLTRIIELELDLQGGRQYLALGPEVLVHFGLQGPRVLPSPVLGWGGLRDMFVANDQLWLVAETRLWSAAMPEWPQDVDFAALEWTMHVVEPAGPLIGGIASAGSDAQPQVIVVFGERQLYRFEPIAGLEPLAASFSGELLEAEASVIYSAGGTRVTVGDDGVVDSQDDGLEGTISAVYVGFRPDMIEVHGTADGQVMLREHHHCKGGRPWIVGGRRRVAGSGSADGWFAEALAEHASIASFAGFGLELLSVGAPPALIRATLAAAVDELRHTNTCLALARRSGVDLELGALAIGPLTRAGDPAAIAAALIREGCIGEGVAATVAELEAQSCEDPEACAALEGIAEDERRHAALAWASLRWLLDAHPREVAPVLRAQASRLRLEVGCGDDGIRRAIVGELVLPLLGAMVDERARSSC